MRWKLQDNIVCMKGTVQCATAEDGDEAEYICDAHNAECAAYESRIAELEESLAKYAHAVHVGHPKPCDLGTLCPYCYIDHIEFELATARAKIDRLREALPEYDGDWQDWEPGDLHRLADNVHRILYSDTGAPEGPL